MSTRRLMPAAAVLLLAGGLAGVRWWRTHDVGAVERGSQLAVRRGCLSCHGSPGRAADPEGERGIGRIPDFQHDDVTSYARNEDEIREWIQDGKPRRLREEPGQEPEPLLRMPAWRSRLSAGEVNDLVAYVEAVSDFAPIPAPVAAGRVTAARLGCFACHGPQGRGDTPNPGSLKGHIPSWSGSDFAELARDDGEIGEWIRDGAAHRLRDNPLAAFFLNRQAIKMPGFGRFVSDQEIREITAYIRWLRAASGREATPRPER